MIPDPLYLNRICTATDRGISALWDTGKVEEGFDEGGALHCLSDELFLLSVKSSVNGYEEYLEISLGARTVRFCGEEYSLDNRVYASAARSWSPESTVPASAFARAISEVINRADEYIESRAWRSRLLQVSAGRYANIILRKSYATVEYSNALLAEPDLSPDGDVCLTIGVSRDSATCAVVAFVGDLPQEERVHTNNWRSQGYIL